MSKYDKWGFDEDGFNKEGYNKMGFDRDGYNKQGFDIRGYDRKGYHCKTHRDKDGFDVKGFDVDGFDRDGFNADGYDRDGYDRDGFDKSGYDIAGYNKYGYDVDGFDQDGFDKMGYDINGYDKGGYNRDGFDKAGYNRNGFNKMGYDVDGYDCNGFDIEGYNRKGLDRRGFDRDGFDEFGYDLWGYDREGYDIDGYDIWGNDSEKYNILGFDKFGFNREGIHRDGFSIVDFDEEGYLIYTGFNLSGYDREGFNINGFDQDGYDREGFDLEGYDREGFDHSGYNRNGFNVDGYNIHGYDVSGYDRYGYDVDGFDKYGYDRKGFNRNGYDVDGYDRNGYDLSGHVKKIGIKDLKPGMLIYHTKFGEGQIIRFEDNRKYIVVKFLPAGKEYTYEFPTAIGKFLAIEKPDGIAQREASYSYSENEKEKKYFSEIERYLKFSLLPEQIANAKKNFKQETVTHLNTQYYWETRDVGPTFDDVVESVKRDVSRLEDNPYFAHIDYSINPNLYIGKVGIPGWVVDWADSRASLYFQYQMYIGDWNTGLRLARKIDTAKGEYLGYSDLYNALSANTANEASYADDRLAKIIMANQQNKMIHDIIETIQQNQYKIITQPKEDNILVLGCAGSGKTMILMHRIRYLKYNNPDLNMEDIMVISPTNILENESRELSKILDISAVEQLTMAQLYEYLISEILKNFYHEDSLLERMPIREDILNPKYYNVEFLGTCVEKIYQRLNSKSEAAISYQKQMHQKVTQNLKTCREAYGSYNEFLNLQKSYKNAKEELDKFYEADFDSVISLNNHASEKIETLQVSLKLAEIVLTQPWIKKEKSADTTQENNQNMSMSQSVLKETRNLLKHIDAGELFRFFRKNDPVCESASHFLQIVCAFKNFGEEIKKELLFDARSELEGYTDQHLQTYIKETEKYISQLESLPRKVEIIRHLKAEGLMKKGSRHEMSEMDQLRVASALKDFCDKMNWQADDNFPFEVFEKYDGLKEKRDRLTEFEKGYKWRFLQDMIFEELDMCDESGNYTLTNSKLFAITYILQKLSAYRKREERIIFVDEFQDFSDLELKLLQQMYPNSVFNLFGDYRQCINPKGIKSAKAFNMKRYFKNKYEINENYRNAKAITEYVNSKFNMDMLGIGVAGKVDVTTSPTAMPLEKGDRGAIIVPDEYSEVTDFDGMNVVRFDVEGIIERDVFNLIPVSLAKGLEFEKVIVMSKGMTKNQKYVACTRAINQLQVVE